MNPASSPLRLSIIVATFAFGLAGIGPAAAESMPDTENGRYALSPVADGVIRLDTRTGAVRPEVWERWLAWDPVRMVPGYAAALRSLRAIWIDAGTADDFFLDLGAEAFRAGLAGIGVPDEKIHFELFEATHAAIEYRYPLSLGWLCQRIAT